MKRRVLVIGAGPAGLAAATSLLESARDRLDVTLVHQGHHFGGKASSTRRPDGRFVEHGWHMVVGFYDRLRALLRRAGVDDRSVFVSMKGQSHPYEAWSRRLHTLDAGGDAVAFAARFATYDGLPGADRANYSAFMSQAFLEAFSGADLTRHDDLCFDTFAVEHGLRPHVTRYSVFRFLREAYFNFPERISAYHVLQSMRLMSSPKRAEAFVCVGPWSEVVWEPIARYFLALGGVVEPFTLATDWVWTGNRISGVRVARPDSAGHAEGAGPWRGEVRAAAGTERTLEGFDFVISTIPHAVFVKMNRDEERMWRSPWFARLKNLRSAATVSMTLTTTKPVLADKPGPVFGFPAPLGITVNMKPYWREYRDDPSVGSVLDFVGQEAGFEAWTDEQVVSHTLDAFSRAPQVGDLRAAGVRDVELHRNTSDAERLLLCEPGVNQFRPGPRTPFSNLFVAGDWVRNDVDLICMEGAVASGQAAAAEVVARLACRSPQPEREDGAPAHQHDEEKEPALPRQHPLRRLGAAGGVEAVLDHQRDERRPQRQVGVQEEEVDLHEVADLRQPRGVREVQRHDRQQRRGDGLPPTSRADEAPSSSGQAHRAVEAADGRLRHRSVFVVSRKSLRPHALSKSSKRAARRRGRRAG